MILRPLDRDRLRHEFRTSQPFPLLSIDEFLEPEFAREIAGSYPSFEEAERVGHEFKFVNEQRKVQITDRTKFPSPVARLTEALASPAFLEDLSYITGIPNLLADPKLQGGGMHLTGPGGRLDVHVDFNFLESDSWYRRLNILIYLNEEWNAEWGGELELWDKNVQRRHHVFQPKLNRMVLFETSEISYHGVRPLTCPPDVVRCSYAAYFYTKEQPPGYSGRSHSTLFRARPDELFRGYVLMPAEKVQRRLVKRLRGARARLKGLIGG
jgi:Rps23 Pro-64 3,4-dihydroxylase Tpa1-like proline 4-hydroxylase